MKAYKIEVLVIDHENLGEEGIIQEIENSRYLMPSVMNIIGADIGEWHDDHPLNHLDQQEEEFDRLFGQG